MNRQWHGQWIAAVVGANGIPVLGVGRFRAFRHAGAWRALPGNDLALANT